MGHVLVTPTGTTGTVVAVHNRTGNQNMRDLTVADTHTYYVVAGHTPVLVHNCGGSYSPGDVTVWPPNNGFHGTPGVTVLKPGTLVDRFGYEGGRFVSPNGASIGGRALAPGTTARPYTVYEVTNRLVVQHGPAEPWFGQPGMQTQYYLPASVSDLLDAGYLRQVS